MNVLKEKQSILNQSRLKQIELNSKIDETNAKLEVKEAKDKKRKIEIKNLIENKKLREFEIEQQRLRDEMDIPDPDDYKSHNSSDDEKDNATSRSPSKMEKDKQDGSVAETPKSNIPPGKKSAMSNKNPKEEEDKKDDDKDKKKEDKKEDKKDSKAKTEEKSDSDIKAFA